MVKAASIKAQILAKVESSFALLFAIYLTVFTMANPVVNANLPTANSSFFHNNIRMLSDTNAGAHIKSTNDDGSYAYDSDNDGIAVTDCLLASNFWNFNWLIATSAYACSKTGGSDGDGSNVDATTKTQLIDNLQANGTKVTPENVVEIK